MEMSHQLRNPTALPAG